MIGERWQIFMGLFTLVILLSIGVSAVKQQNRQRMDGWDSIGNGAYTRVITQDEERFLVVVNSSSCAVVSLDQE